jgi:hypothetical protein
LTNPCLLVALSSPASSIALLSLPRSYGKTKHKYIKYNKQIECKCLLVTLLAFKLVMTTISRSCSSSTE